MCTDHSVEVVGPLKAFIFRAAAGQAGWLSGKWSGLEQYLGHLIGP